MEKINPKQASEEILESKNCKKLPLERLYTIIGIELVLSDQETSDKFPEHYIDAEFHAQSEYRVNSGQFSTIPDIIRDLHYEIMRICLNGEQGLDRLASGRQTYGIIKHNIGASCPHKSLIQNHNLESGTFLLPFMSGRSRK